MDEPRSEIDWRVVHTMQLGISGLIVFVMVVIWAVTGFGDYFWPIWVWFGLTIPLARAVRDPKGQRGAARSGGRSTPTPRCRAVAGGILTFIWALTGFGFWLFWPLFGMSIALGLHALLTVLVARPASGAREGADRARGRADPHPPRRAGRPGRRAAPDRARPARRRAGPARRAEHAARPRRGSPRRPPRGRRARAQRPRRGVQRDQGAARPRARHRSARAGRPRPARRGRLARRALRAAGHGQRADQPPALAGRRVRRLLRRRRVADQRRQVRPRRRRRACRCSRRAAAWSSRSTTTARAARTRDGNGLTGLRNRVEALDGILVVRSNPGEGTTVHAELPCE